MHRTHAPLRDDFQVYVAVPWVRAVLMQQKKKKRTNRQTKVGEDRSILGQKDR